MRKTIQLLVGLVISAVAFWLAFRDVQLALVAEALRKANPFYLAVSVLLVGLGFGSRALSWRAILGMRLAYGRVFDAMLAGFLLNNLLPFRLGELGRAYLIGREPGLTPTQGVSSVLVERLIDLLLVLVILAAFLPLVVGVDLVRNAAGLSALLGAVAVAGLVLMARYRHLALRLLRAILTRLRLPWLSPERWEPRAAEFLDGLAVLQDPRRAITATFWSAGAWVCAGLGAWLLLLALLPGATLTMGFFTLAVVGLGIAVPSAPGSAGVFELAAVEALAVFDVDRSLGLTFALFFHLTHVVITSVFGGLALSREGETLGHLARSAQGLMARPRPPEPAGVGGNDK